MVWRRGRAGSLPTVVTARLILVREWAGQGTGRLTGDRRRRSIGTAKKLPPRRRPDEQDTRGMEPGDSEADGRSGGAPSRLPSPSRAEPSGAADRGDRRGA